MCGRMLEPVIRYENQDWMQSRRQSLASSGFVRKLVEWGVVSTQEQATYMLVGVIIAALCGGLFFSWDFIFHSSVRNAPELPIPPHTRQL